MYSKTKKVLSLAMSAAILLTNIMTPMKVYADEVNEPAQDLESEMLLETEPLSYYLTLPYYEEVSYSVDKNHVEATGAQDKDMMKQLSKWWMPIYSEKNYFQVRRRLLTG